MLSETPNTLVKTEMLLIYVVTCIRTEHLSNKSLQRYHYTNQFRYSLFIFRSFNNVMIGYDHAVQLSEVLMYNAESRVLLHWN
jgi:hypothetical protein